MEFRDLKKQYQVLRAEMDHAVLGAMASGAYIMGPQVRELEQQLADYVGVKHCLTCANGTDALTLALKAWGIGPGDAVFVPDFTFFSSAEVVPLEGATPVFVDVCEETFNIDVADLERAVKEVLAEGRLRPRVVVAVDLFGLPADYQAVRAVADRYGLLVLEDGAQGFGGSIERFPVKPGMTGDVMAGCDRPSKRACSLGDIATTSFFPAKPLGCYGDGGAVFTDNDEWAALINSYRVHGKGTFKYDNVRIGLNSRLDTVQAAVLQVKLKAFAEYEMDDINDAAEKYTERLKDIVATPVIPAGYRSSWAQYTVKLQDSVQRDALQAALKAEGIPSMVYYPKPLHLQTAFADPHVGLRPPQDDNLCPVATSLCSRVLSLPLHPYITEEQIETVCTAIRKALR
ncbi:MAG: DegT/DnrJ/EryC1/StrS aminotransferase family protein [Bacteroidales bacterium]|nr:DegT/DnrJ/EryC1/StrS aminotransferase family protein [Bacteroidales bacterium]